MVADWSAIRDEFESMPGVAYLNTGTCGRTPRSVMREAAEWRHRLAAEPCEILWRRLPEALWPARERVASFVGARPENIIFMANVTAGVNTLTNGLKLERGRDVLLTDQEYGAMAFAWERAASRASASIKTIALPVGANFSKQDLLDRFDTALNRQTQLLFISHISTATGLILPVHEICAMARERGILSVIDGAHAPGMIDVDLDSIGCDFYAANGHKWLLAPCGSGFLFVRPGLEDRIEPLVVSWGWKYDQARSQSRDQEGSTHFIRSHEFQGTRDPAPWLAMPAAIRFAEQIGVDLIQARDRELANFSRRRLASIPGIEPMTPDDPGLSAALAAYRLPQGPAVEIQRTLWQQHLIETPVLDRPQGACLRVSTHFYNTEDEIDRLFTAVKLLFP